MPAAPHDRWCATPSPYPDEPADLFLAERPEWDPRPAPRPSVPLARQLVSSAPAPDPEHREALSLIRGLEPRPRGAFAGLVGWTDAAGHGQWGPVLRSVHLHGTRARLHAAAELDAAATVDGALAETAANFGTVRAALAAAGALERAAACSAVPDAA